MSGAALRRGAGAAATYGLSLLAALVFMAPLLWALDLSLKSRIDVFAFPPKVLDFRPTLDNYASVLAPEGGFLQALGSSLLVALLSTVTAVAIGACAAFAMSGRRRAARSGHILGLMMLVFRMAPPVAMLIPYYVVFKSLGLVGTRAALFLTHGAFALAVVTWIIKGFLDEIPPEIEEAAMMDGASPVQVFLQIVLPLSKGVLTAACIFAFLTSWNEFLFASVLSSAATRTLPIAIASFIGEVYTSWGELAAATVIGLLPTLLFAFLGQRYLLAGLAPRGGR